MSFVAPEGGSSAFSQWCGHILEKKDSVVGRPIYVGPADALKDREKAMKSASSSSYISPKFIDLCLEHWNPFLGNK